MGFSVHATADAAEGLRAVGDHLRRDPVANNVVLTLLESAASGADLRLWWVADNQRGGAVGALFQGPLVYPGVLSRLEGGAPVAEALARAVATSIADAAGHAATVWSHPLDKVRGGAGDVASFAGAFAAATARSGFPDEAFRMLVCDDVARPDVAGRARVATDADADLVTDWTQAFVVAIGDPTPDRAGADALIGPRLGRGDVWLWDVDGAAVSMASTVASTTTPVARIGLVYTPPEHQRHGYAAAVTAALTEGVLDAGRSAMLLTQLSNPTSNALYGRLGYRAVAEELIYRFD